MRESFRKQLIESGYIHDLLKPDMEKTLEARLFKKPVTKRRLLWDGQSLSPWTGNGTGEAALNYGGIKLCTPSRLEPTEKMVHHTGFNSYSVTLNLPGEDWREYNRLIFKMKPDCPGHHEPHMTVSLRNDGEVKIPDMYNREGHHVINLENRGWNDCVWEFPDMPRDAVTALSFALNSHGRERFAADTFAVSIKEIWLEQAEGPDVSLGWQGNPGTVSYSATGYWLKGNKTAIANEMAGVFEIVEENSGDTVFAASMTQLVNEKGTYGILDFSDLEMEGRFYIKVGDYRTDSFAIGEKVMEEAVWKVLNFVYSERCGYPVSGGHTSCHWDLIAELLGASLSH